MKRFVILYIVYMVIAFILVDYKPVRDFLQLDAYYTGAVVEWSVWLIQLIGIEVRAQGPMLFIENAILEVKFGCNGLEAIMLYTAAVLAYPACAKARVIGIVAGSLFLQVLNLIRIAILSWVLVNEQQYFGIMHEYITQSIMIALAFFAFVTYLYYAGEQYAEAESDPANS